MYTPGEIYNALNTHVEYIKAKVMPRERIFGIFALGLPNYGFCEKPEDMKSLIIYLPSETELFTSCDPMDTYYYYHDGSKIIIKDIRSIYNLALSQDNFLMEALFTDYYIINPKYQDLYRKMKDAAEGVFHYCRWRRVKFAVNRARTAKEKFFETNNFDYLFEYARIDIAIQKYLSGVPCEYCIKLRDQKDIEYLRNIRNGNKLTPRLEDLDAIEARFEEALSMVALDVDTAQSNSFKELIFQIVKFSTTDSASKIDDFLNDLTNTERDCLIYVLNVTGGNGSFAVSNAIKEVTYTRPVFKSLLNKLEQHNIAVVTNRGAKGIHVKVIDSGIFERVHPER